jgi:ATP adenylyltransferase
MTLTDVTGCLACDLTNGRQPLPGGTIYRTSTWTVDHCVGPLGIGTLIVRPIRHVTRVSELNQRESAEFGPVLQRTAAVVDELLHPDQVYVCLWSHAGGNPVHIHYVVQPARREMIEQFTAYGPRLQVAMFDRAETPAPTEVEAFAERARTAFKRTGD